MFKKGRQGPLAVKAIEPQSELQTQTDHNHSIVFSAK